MAHAQSPLQTVEYRFNDFHHIWVNDNEVKLGKRPLKVIDTNSFHAASVQYIEEQATLATNQGQTLLVLTHHTPSFQGTSNKYKPDWDYLRFGESSDLSRLLDHVTYGQYAAIHTWVFGHTHYNCDQQLYSTRVVSNQRGGKNHLTRSYQKTFCLDIPASSASSSTSLTAGSEKTNKIKMAGKDEDILFANAVITRALHDLPSLLSSGSGRSRPPVAASVLRALQSCLRASQPREKLLLRSLRHVLTCAVMFLLF